MKPGARAARASLAGPAGLLLLGLAGCGEAPPADRPPTKIVNPFHDQLSALPGDLQRLGLMRAIRDNGRNCRRVEAGRYQRDYGQMAMWVARCADDRNWAIFIAPNGDTQLRQCTEMEELRLPACEPVPDPGPEADEAAVSGETAR